MTEEMSKSELRRRIREEGAPLAYAALTRVLKDPNASSTALSAASRTMMDLAGLIKEADAPKKEPHEMDSHEIAQEIKDIQDRRQEQLDAREASLREFEEFLNRAAAELQLEARPSVFD